MFDAVAALIGLRSEVLYEGQAAIELEVLAHSRGQADIYPFDIEERTTEYSQGMQLQAAPVIRAIVSDIQHGQPASQIARRFHRSIAELLATACHHAREQTGLNVVALSGGVFQNRLLLVQLVELLEEMDFQVYINRRVPPNDGGLSLCQLVVAASKCRNNMVQ